MHVEPRAIHRQADRSPLPWVIGAVLLFVRVAQHETQPLSAGRVLRWLLSLWLWPALLLFTRKRPG